MAFDFPANPTDGQFYQAPNGPLYVWRNTQWYMVTTSPIANSVLARNRIVNGAMQISQENGRTGSGAVNFYIADQWQGSFTSLGAGVPNFTSVVATPGEMAIGAPPYYARMNSGGVAVTSLSATASYLLGQTIEGVRVADFNWGIPVARRAVLKFRALVSSGILTISVTLRNAAVDRSFCKKVDVTSTWADYTVIIPVDTVGPWATGNSASILLGFSMAAGTTYTTPTDGAWVSGNFTAASGTSNIMDSASRFFYVGNVGLYLDADGTGIGPRWELPDEADELAACQRYWQSVQFSYNGYAQQYLSKYVYLPVIMRTAPIMSLTYNGGAGVTVGGNAQYITVMGGEVYHTIPAPGVVALLETVRSSARM